MNTDPNRWRDLSTYNAERARGIVHSLEWNERMLLEQAHFDAEINWERRQRVPDRDD